MNMPYLLHEPKGVLNPPTLVVLPGVNSGIYLFKETVGTLGNSHRLVVFNPPGVLGASMPLPFTAGAYARQVLGALEEMKSGRFALLGHSLGGFAAQELARLAPERVERLVLVSTSMGQPYTMRDMRLVKQASGMSFNELGREIARDPHTYMKVFFGPTYPVDKADAYATFIAEREAALPPRAVSLAQLSAGALFSSRRWASSLTVPTLVVHGSADVLVSSASGKALAEALPRARYMEFFNTGHFPMLEHAGFYAAVQRFLAGHPEGAEPDRNRPGFWQRLYNDWFTLHG